jgi:catechol 2,3-dioxygenase-like lactoylglutathione lyase family enzyme
MLTHAPMTTILPVKDLARARDFYQNKLGLEPQGMQADGKFLFRANGGAVLALFPKPEGTKAEHTAISFLVSDIVAEIRALETRGVTFHDYDLPGFKTVEHVCVLGSEKAAWFNDPEGNILCLHEDIGGKR